MLHGGDLSGTVRIFGIARGDWLDLSTGINPLAYPVPQLGNECWARLPDSMDIAGLEEAARSYFDAPETCSIVAGAGSTAFIQALPGAFSFRTVNIVSPTYSEHETALRMRPCDVAHIPDLEHKGADAVILVNPNNPDGRRFDPNKLLTVAKALGERGGLLIVDEAFADPHPEISLAPYAGSPGLIVLRSFGKFFGLAGLRLGFALGTQADIAKLQTRIGPWAVSGPAVKIGGIALNDKIWIEKTKARLKRDALRLDEIIKSSGFDIAGGTDLFRLIDMDEAHILHTRLAEQGIWTRFFDYNPRWLRLGLPGSDADFMRLEKALQARPK